MATTTEPNPPTTSGGHSYQAAGQALYGDQPPRLHSGKAFFWGIVLILTAGILAWLFIGYFGTDRFQDLDQKRVLERQEILKKRNEEDHKLLNEPPSYLDKEKGKIRVPLADAMRLAMVDLQKSQPRAAYPLSQSPPQPAAAPTSPDKGAGSPKDGSINPSASNPTLNQASPAPAAQQSPTPAAPAQAATPPPANAPSAAATPQTGTAATSTPAPNPTPAASNNALNPGSAPGPGAQPQPSPKPPDNTETTGASPTPSGAKSQPLTNPTPRPDSPSSDQQTPGATPGGTPS